MSNIDRDIPNPKKLCYETVYTYLTYCVFTLEPSRSRWVRHKLGRSSLPTASNVSCSIVSLNVVHDKSRWVKLWRHCSNNKKIDFQQIHNTFCWLLSLKPEGGVSHIESRSLCCNFIKLLYLNSGLCLFYFRLKLDLSLIVMSISPIPAFSKDIFKNFEKGVYNSRTLWPGLPKSMSCSSSLKRDNVWKVSLRWFENVGGVWHSTIHKQTNRPTVCWLKHTPLFH